MGLPSWARVGAKVVCVEAPNVSNICTDALTKRMPAVGEIYTINDLGVARGAMKTAWVGLSELDQDVAYSIRFFRPLVTVEDDLKAHFAHHLTTSSPQGVDA